MSSNIFLIITVVTTGIFVIQFILSIFFGDIDADTDVDADISSVVSFKGLTHFGIGFGWYMYLIGNTDIQSYSIAILIGLTTVITHRKNITEKLGIKSVSGLTIYAVMNGYIEADRI